MAAALACGKRGNPLPPLRPVPARIADASAVRTGQTVTIKFTVPAANLDGTTPPSISRIDVFALQAAQGVTPPAAGAIASERRNFRASLAVVVPPPDEATPPATPAKGLVAGGAGVFTDQLANVDPTAVALAYVLVPVSGMGRGRQGPPSPPLIVPVGSPPVAPAEVSLTSDEANVHAAWQVATSTTGLTYQLVRVGAGGEPLEGSAGLAIPVAANGAEASFPVEFGKEICVAVRPSIVTGRVTVEGPLSRPACLTAVDRYAPPAPSGFQAVQEGTGVLLSWSAVTASDLAGYVVLRGADSGDSLQPLMRTPIKETTYRDTTVKPGVTYFYAVYAEDTAAPANVSQLSGRQTVTVR